MPFTKQQAINLIEASDELCGEIKAELDKYSRDYERLDIDELLEAERTLCAVDTMLTELYNARAPRPYDSAAGLALITVAKVTAELRSVLNYLGNPFVEE